MHPYATMDVNPAGHEPLMRLSSPKLGKLDRARTIYPYYAGFSESFVESAFDRLGIDNHSRILDPWNGSGTTTLIAGRRGAHSTGIDLNPVAINISTARCASQEEVSLVRDLTKYLGAAESELDAYWSEPFVAIRRFEAEIQSKFPRRNLCASALVSVAIYSAIRSTCCEAKTRNPVWYKKDIKINISSSDFLNRFKQALDDVLARQSDSCSTIQVSPRFICTDFSHWKERSGIYDAIVTSPPYLTRLDYVRATYPELSYYASYSEFNPEKLRINMLGSPITSSLAVAVPETIGKEALNVLENIRSHPSKASATYYYRFYSRYFIGLNLAMSKISRLLKKQGAAAIVVQTSNYKDLCVDLPKIVAEMGGMHGLQPSNTVEFRQKLSINYLNTRSISSKQKFSPVESVVFFRK